MTEDRKPYGEELILDLHNCDPSTFNRTSLDEYFTLICEKIDMVRCEVYFWDDLYTPDGEKMTEPHTVGTSAVCFILTSNITIHTLDMLKAVYVNIFTCKPFDPKIAEEFTKEWFKSDDCRVQFLKRI